MTKRELKQGVTKMIAEGGLGTETYYDYERKIAERKSLQAFRENVITDDALDANAYNYYGVEITDRTLVAIEEVNLDKMEENWMN